MGRRPPAAPRIVIMLGNSPKYATKEELWAVVGPLLAGLIAAAKRAQVARNDSAPPVEESSDGVLPEQPELPRL